MTSEQRLQDMPPEDRAGWNGADSMAQEEDGMQEGERTDAGTRGKLHHAY